MAVICKECGHVNEDESIQQTNENGGPAFIAGKYTPRYSCVNCGGKDIASAD